MRKANLSSFLLFYLLPLLWFGGGAVLLITFPFSGDSHFFSAECLLLFFYFLAWLVRKGGRWTVWRGFSAWSQLWLTDFFHVITSFSTDEPTYRPDHFCSNIFLMRAHQTVKHSWIKLSQLWNHLVRKLSYFGFSKDPIMMWSCNDVVSTCFFINWVEVCVHQKIFLCWHVKMP